MALDSDAQHRIALPGKIVTIVAQFRGGSQQAMDQQHAKAIAMGRLDEEWRRIGDGRFALFDLPVSRAAIDLLFEGQRQQFIVVMPGSQLAVGDVWVILVRLQQSIANGAQGSRFVVVYGNGVFQVDAVEVVIRAEFWQEVIAAVLLAEQFRFLGEADELLEAQAGAKHQIAVVIGIQQAAVQVDGGVFLQFFDADIQHRIEALLFDLLASCVDQAHDQRRGQMAEVHGDIGVDSFHVLVA